MELNKQDIEYSYETLTEQDKEYINKKSKKIKEELIEITLSLPPSVNALYANSKKGRKKTQEYKDWIEIVMYEFLKQKKYNITGNNWLFAHYEFYFPLYTKEGKIRKIDVENYIKATSDALGRNIIGFDDSKIKRLLIGKNDSEKCYVNIKIKEM